MNSKEAQAELGMFKGHSKGRPAEPVDNDCMGQWCEPSSATQQGPDHKGPCKSMVNADFILKAVGV